MSTRTWLSSLVVVVAAGIAVGPEQHVEACGMDFPTNLILRRADALATMWEGSFAEEASRLVPVSERDRTAFEAGPELVPASAREQALYAKAAERFHAGAFDEAASGFEALLRLPPQERRRFSVAAAYSLGRARDATYASDRAIAAYRQVRALARAGFGDDQDLAKSSLGQEARTERWHREHLATAVRLYAEQAALGGAGAVTSLYMVVRMMPAKDRAQLYRDDVGTSLIALYFYTRGSELDDDERATWKRELARQVTSEARGAAYMAASAYRAGEWDAAAAFAMRCKRAPIATWVKAKLALRDGDRVRAEELLRTVERGGLVGNRDSDIASYALDYDPRSLVRAEIGLLALADARFTEAADWFARGDRDIEAGYVIERAMSLDELLAAIQNTREARRAGSPAIAEGTDPDDVCRYWDRPIDEHGYCPARRLLDIYARRLLREHRYDEALDAFADSEASATAKANAKADGNAGATADADTDAAASADADADADATADAGATADADATDDADATEHPTVVAHTNAIAFVEAIKRADASTGIERAEHLFRAARTMRVRGMEIAGTEVGPDWRIYDGGYRRSMPCLPSPTRGYDRFAERTDDDYDDDWGEACVRPTRADAALISPLEMERVRSSAPEVDQRFSYRYAASRLAEQAAGLLPPRSQSYAMALCWAAKFARRDRTRVEELYATYVRNGARRFGSGFGEDCDDPDFRSARTFDEDLAQERLENALAAERRHAWTWPRVRDAVWRRRAWLAVPAAGLLFLVLLWRLIAARAATAAKSSTRD